MPQREFGIDAFLDGGESQLLQALHIEPGERLELEIGQRTSPPQRFGLPKQRRRALKVVAIQRPSPGTDQALELVQVELAGFDTQEVSGGSRGSVAPPAFPVPPAWCAGARC